MAQYLFVFVVLLASGFGSESLADELEDEEESLPAFEINIGILLPGDDSFAYSLSRVTPGIRYALASERFKTLLPNHNVTSHVKIMDSECSALIAPLRAMEAMVKTEHQRRLDLLLGPACDLVGGPVARYNTQWQTCMISAGCGASGFSDKNSLFVTRVLLNFEESGMVFGNIISSQFDYSRIIMITQEIHRDNNDCYWINQGVGKYFTQHLFAPDNEFVSPNAPNFTQYLMDLELHKRARGKIYFFFPSNFIVPTLSHTVLYQTLPLCGITMSTKILIRTTVNNCEYYDIIFTIKV